MKSVTAVAAFVLLSSRGYAQSTASYWSVDEYWDASACGGGSTSATFQGRLFQQDSTFVFLKDGESSGISGLIENGIFKAKEVLSVAGRHEVLESRFTTERDVLRGEGGRTVLVEGQNECVEIGSYIGHRMLDVLVPGAAALMDADLQADVESSPALINLPAPPLRITVGNLGSVTITWDAVTGATGYRLYYSTVAGAEFSLQQSMDLKNTRTFTRVLPPGKYYVFVQSYNATGEGYMERWQSFTINPPPNPPVVTLSTFGSFASASWEAIAGVSKYILHYSPNASGVPATTVDMGFQTSITTMMPPGATYYVAVQSYSTITGLGPLSAWKPVTMPVDGGPVSSAPADRLAVGYSHACALTKANEAWCWGELRQSGSGSTSFNETLVPLKVSGDYKFIQLAASGDATFGLTATGELYVWGVNKFGVFGDAGGPGSAFDETRVQAVPKKVPLTVRLQAIDAAAGTVCGLDLGGSVYCWGSVESGKTYAAPVRINSTAKFAKLSVGIYGFHALTADGAAWAWGSNYSCVLGVATSSCGEVYSSAVQIGGSLKFKQIARGMSPDACGITLADELYCWGIGDVNTKLAESARRTPSKLVTSLKLSSIAVGGRGLVGLTADGTAYVLGQEWRVCPCSQPLQYIEAPKLVSSTVKFDAIVAGNNSVLGLDAATGYVRGWGEGAYGLLNTGAIQGSDLEPLAPATVGFNFSPTSINLSIEQGKSSQVPLTLVPRDDGFTVNGPQKFSSEVGVYLAGAEGAGIQTSFSVPTLTRDNPKGVLTVTVPTDATVGTSSVYLATTIDGAPRNCVGGTDMTNTACKVSLKVTAPPPPPPPPSTGSPGSGSSGSGTTLDWKNNWLYVQGDKPVQFRLAKVREEGKNMYFRVQYRVDPAYVYFRSTDQGYHLYRTTNALKTYRVDFGPEFVGTGIAYEPPIEVAEFVDGVNVLWDSVNNQLVYRNSLYGLSSYTVCVSQNSGVSRCERDFSFKLSDVNAGRYQAVGNVIVK